MKKEVQIATAMFNARLNVLQEQLFHSCYTNDPSIFLWLRVMWLEEDKDIRGIRPSCLNPAVAIMHHFTLISCKKSHQTAHLEIMKNKGCKGLCKGILSHLLCSLAHCQHWIRVNAKIKPVAKLRSKHSQTCRHVFTAKKRPTWKQMHNGVFFFTSFLIDFCKRLSSHSNWFNFGRHKLALI